MSGTPRTSKAVEALLASMGVADYEPRVVQQLLEYGYRYATEILQDSNAFAEHASRSFVQAADVRLAIESRAPQFLSGPPTRDFLAELAERRNAVPLPPVKETYGIRLPADRYTLTGVNFQVVPQIVGKRRREDESGPGLEAQMATLQGELMAAAASAQPTGPATAPQAPVSAFPPAAIIRAPQPAAGADEDEYD
ncbi:transcription initiation factor IID, 31kD subunit-domain-containing protein [Hyaloraphidium curvatum]|nr:transcription initiation factor IID, 31kD subunit-domain-containing protein [Hyaloraphidium curvatum]